MGGLDFAVGRIVVVKHIELGKRLNDYADSKCVKIKHMDIIRLCIKILSTNESRRMLLNEKN